MGDLTYCELQQDLFDYLFPVCLMDWHFTLMRDESCQHEFEFHRAMRNGNIFQKMMNNDQRQEVFEFFRDSFLERLDSESESVTSTSVRLKPKWIYRFNSLGMVMPRIDLIWCPWWEMETLGRAVAALEYLSGLMYLEGDNPLFREQKRALPLIFANDSMNFDAGWLEENLDFLKQELTVDFFQSSLSRAVRRLHGHQLENIAQQFLDDLPICRDLVAARIEELPCLLAEAQPDRWTGRFTY
ncbi:MAG: hypothetical protein KDA90_01275 [Planctomycetaceae bacterium]|nr:hypothetical protein [Planctomycetaceae bacterium]